MTCPKEVVEGKKEKGASTITKEVGWRKEPIQGAKGAVL